MYSDIKSNLLGSTLHKICILKMQKSSSGKADPSFLLGIFLLHFLNMRSVFKEIYVKIYEKKYITIKVSFA